jgi:amino acid adenylation domain-containing protein
MTVHELLSKLRSLDVKIWADKGELFCNAPKGTLRAELRAEINERKAEILGFLHDASATARSVDPPMQPVPRDGDLPLSFAQERLWLLDQLEPGSSVYHMSSTFRLIGPLNTAALERSFTEIVRRHEALRTTFTTVEDRPVQVITPSSGTAGINLFSLLVVDLRHLGESEREAEALRRVGEEIRRPFNLKTDLMLRAGLLRLGAEDHLLFLVTHHIASDGWSMGILYRELSILYEAFSNHRPSPLPDVPIQYADFAQWQRNWLQGEVLAAQVGYWKRQLRDLAILELPTDRPRPAVQTYRGGRQTARLAKGPADALKALSRRESASLFMTLLAAFQSLLYRYTGQEDIVIGSPIANRNRTRIEGLIGFFLNTLVLRTDLSGDCTFRELLGRVREVTLGAYAHQDLPFEKLLEELRPERELSRTPLFQIYFNMVNVEASSLKLSGLQVQPVPTADVLSKFDLTLYVRERDDGLQLQLVYNTDLFKPGTIKRLLGHYLTLLEGIVEDPDRALLHYRLLTGEEREELAKRGNRIGPDNAFVEFKREEVEQSIAARFAQQVRLFPDKAAVKTKQHQWSYGDLNRRSNQIARAVLTRCGSGEERVALLFEHGPAMIAAMLGVIKSAKAYVPLEPSYPVERLGYILQDTEAGVILSDRRNLRLARELAHGSVAVIDIEGIDPATPAEDLSITVSSEAIAYILYTSGSTGQPKGVMQNHRNVLHHIRCYTNNLHIASADKLTLLSSYGFDAAVMDIFGALLNGATLYPLDVRDEEPGALRRRIAREALTIYHSTPTVYRYLCDGLSRREEFSTVRLVVLGGEEAQTADMELFREFFPENSLLVNGLGPTESTLALQYFMNHRGKPLGRIVPVGYPVQDTEIWLLNRDGTDSEIYGEIGISSEHVALGYWRREELSKAVFLPGPGGAGRRIYRSGDMGRLMADGSIGYLGRRDSQVKIRGYRIELGEIEAALNQHPAVREAVVVVQEDSPAEKRLVAYIVAVQERALSAGEWRSSLKAKLPDYMVPWGFMYLDRLPLTPNGKLDRGALPKFDERMLESSCAFIAPRTPIEEMLVEIWCEVLGGKRAGIHDNFFDLGGHSLLAVQVISRLRQAFYVEIPLRVFFENPTVASLAAIVEESAKNGASPGTIHELLDDLESLSDEEARELAHRSMTNFSIGKGKEF